MNRAEAFKTLKLDPSADGHMVNSAYWTLVRQAQSRGGTDPQAQYEIERLNEAYQTLSPDGRTPAPIRPPRQTAVAGTGVEFLDGFADWCADQALRTRVRWMNRNPEIALIGGCAIVLTLLALSAGASAFAVLLVVALMCVAIWAPWRRVELPAETPQQQPEQLPEPSRRARRA